MAAEPRKRQYGPKRAIPYEEPPEIDEKRAFPFVKTDEEELKLLKADRVKLKKEAEEAQEKYRNRMYELEERMRDEYLQQVRRAAQKQYRMELKHESKGRARREQGESKARAKG